MGLGPGDAKTDKRGQQQRRQAPPPQNSAWQMLPDPVVPFDDQVEYQHYDLLTPDQVKQYYAVYTTDKLFGFFFPLFQHKTNPNCFLCVHWNPLLAPAENVSGKKFKLLATAAGVEVLTVLPFYVLDKNMDDTVSDEELPPHDGETSRMQHIKKALGNFYKWRNEDEEQVFAKADIVFINGNGQLFPLSWAEVRERIPRDEMLKEAIDVLLVHDGMKFLPKFLLGHFQ